MTIAIVQARLGSTRFPKKVLQEIQGRPLLVYLLERLSRSKRLEKVVLAVPEGETQFAQFTSNIAYGSEEDVLARFAHAARSFPAESYLRVTADCPLLDPQVVDELIDLYDASPVHYASNVLPRSYPRGFDVEIFSAALLQECDKSARDPWEREHVTPWMQEKKSATLQYKEDASHYRLTVDTPEDFFVVQTVVEAMEGMTYGVDDVVRFCRENASIFEVNRSIQQKERGCD